MSQPGDKADVPVQTMLGMVERVAHERPDDTALIERPEDDDAGADPPAGRSLSFAELIAHVRTLRVDLLAAGIRSGDVVGLWLPNWHELVVWELAVTSLGAAVLGVNTRYNTHELAHLLVRAQPRCLAMPGAFLGIDFIGRLRAATDRVAAEHPEVPLPAVAVVRPGHDSPAGFDLGGGAWAPQQPATGPPPTEGPRAGPDTLAHLFTTSGSTGAPKLAAHDQHSVVRHSAHVVRRLDLRPGDAFLAALPLTGVFGFTPAYAALGCGAACVLEPVVRADETVVDMARFGVTHVVGADDLLGRIKDAWQRRPADLSTWRVGGIGNFVGRVGEIAEWAEAEFGTAIAGVYGSSELFALTAMWPLDRPLPDRASAGGRIVADEIDCRVTDPSSGQPIAAGHVGELQFRGYNVLREYYGDPDATAAAFTADGWVRSGDLGYARADGDGLVYLCRAGDELRLRGFLVDPAELEHVIADHPAVDVAKVVGVTRAGQGDVAVAFVTLAERASCDENELSAWCHQHLAPFKVPARVVILEEFPVTVGVNGTKIRTAALRERASELVDDATASSH